MGQYYKVCNLDKKEYLYPHRFGDGLKLLEFGASGGGTMCGLAVLLATSNGRGGGDLHTKTMAMPGRWAGDRIAVVGDYDHDEGSPTKDIYAACGGTAWKDISWLVIDAMLDDGRLAEELAKGAISDWRLSDFENETKSAQGVERRARKRLLALYYRQHGKPDNAAQVELELAARAAK
jgi:hypothetical protein